jgi:hypothetical protein
MEVEGSFGAAVGAAATKAAKREVKMIEARILMGGVWLLEWNEEEIVLMEGVGFGM